MGKKKSNVAMMIGVPVAIIAVLVGAVVMFVLPPSSEAVCKKMFTLMKSYYSEQTGLDASKITEEDLGGFTMDSCVKSTNRAVEMDGLFKTKSYRSCILGAKSLTDATTCDK